VRASGRWRVGVDIKNIESLAPEVDRSGLFLTQQLSPLLIPAMTTHEKKKVLTENKPT
jgi:hypothetical protein